MHHSEINTTIFDYHYNYAEEPSATRFSYTRGVCVCVCVCVCVRVRVYEIMQRDVEKFDFECFIVTARKSILVSVVRKQSHVFSPC